MKSRARDLPGSLLGRRRLAKASGRSKPRSTDCPSAARAVFSTWELLETILAHLDMRDLLLLQRVSVAFRDVIQNSTPLQQKMFFLPIAGETTAPGDGTVPNPLLMQAFFPLFIDALLPSSHPTVNTDTYHTGLRAAAAAWSEPQRRQDAFNRRGASWRSMLLSQPPPARLKYLNKVSAPRHRERLVAVSRDQPVRMGAVYDLAYYALWRTGAVRVRWQFYANLFDERGRPLPHEIFRAGGIEGPPGAAGLLDIRVEEDAGCASAAPVPHPSQFFPRWSRGSLTRLERLVYRTSKSVRERPRCQYLESEDYDRDAVAEAVLPEGAGIADTERLCRFDRW
ncbi:hypothetical protein PG985_002525 [Apiospora marii]|uniref:F-box domain-containing protein n=1 Tax=Apiospora marii TaxID=335849 RepID=A0ABR1RUC3_9PEZI